MYIQVDMICGCVRNCSIPVNRAFSLVGNIMMPYFHTNLYPHIIGLPENMVITQIQWVTIIP